MNSKLVGTYTETQLASKTIKIPGDTVNIQLISDEYDTEWGFKVIKVTAQMPIEVADVTNLKASSVTATSVSIVVK